MGRSLLSILAAGLVALLLALGSRDVAASSYTQVTAGALHTCAKTVAGGLQCWGDNTYGQVGDGTQQPRSLATTVSGLSSGVSQVDVGSWHSCAVTTTGGALKCWGRNLFGQLGVGDSRNMLTTPIDVCGSGSFSTCVPLTGIAQVSAGAAHTCAVTTGGGVKCWGRNQYGQLGDGTTTQRLNPVDVTGLTSGVASVSAGGSHTCARLVDSTVKCWGLNTYGQLGNGTFTDSSTPVNVATGTALVTAGGNHSCLLSYYYALVLCWGQNQAGQLGDGTQTNRSTPVYAQFGLGAFGPWVEAGGAHTCARNVSGIVKCWGWNFFKQVGDGTGGSGDPAHWGVLTPKSVLGLSAAGDPLANSIAAGDGHTCVTTTTNVVKCWGWNQPATAQNQDLDKDGCQDERELGTNPATGGQRNPKYFWDFYDVWTVKTGNQLPLTNPSAWERNRVVNQSDIDAVTARYGASGSASADPLAPPTNASAYHPAYDRGAQTGPNTWDRAPADGNIDLFNDIYGVAYQNGHDCR
ncbi:MAG: flexitail domain-containing putative surface protein [Dehalococcoidia bacterium]